jgi:hypothetical protein
MSIGRFYVDNGIDPSDPYAIERFLFPEEFFFENIVDAMFENFVDMQERSTRTVFVNKIDPSCTPEQLSVSIYIWKQKSHQGDTLI